MKSSIARYSAERCRAPDLRAEVRTTYPVDLVTQIGEVIGMQDPPAADHFGHIALSYFIRLGRALEKCNMAWLADMIPRQYGDSLKKITDAVKSPVSTGEDIFLKKGFPQPVRMRAADIVHPDLVTSGAFC